MLFQLYRVSYSGLVSYAIQDGELFFLVDFKNTEAPVNPQVSVPVDQCKILPPTQPSKIVGIGLNYKDHAAERNKPLPAEPLIFLKPPSSVIAHNEPILLPSASSRVDPEGELAVIIGETAARLKSPEEARHYIFGYTCFNDVTARDLQDRDVQFTRAKGFDTFAPFGPCIAIGIDPSDLKITTRVNGVARQDSRTSQLIFSPDYLVWYISNIMTLYPGDVITTGTPAGIAPVSAGDVIEVEIESIGTLKNSVLAMPLTR